MELNDLRRLARSLRKNGLAQTLEKARRAAPIDSGDYRRWIRENEPGEAALCLQSAEDFPRPVLVSFVCPVYNPKPAHLRALYASLYAQTAGCWELVLSDGSSARKSYAAAAALARADDRVTVLPLSENRGIAGNTAAAVEHARGELLAFVDDDDTLSPFAVYELLKAYFAHPGADFFYSDEDKFDPLGRFDPHFKPEWSPDTLKSYNYITHLMAMTRDLYERAGGMRPGFDGSQDHDLALRATAASNGIVHIPKVLYHWRAHAGSVAGSGQKPYAQEAGLRAVTESVIKEGGGWADAGLFPNSYRARYPLPSRPLVSIVIPNSDHAGLLRACTASIAATADLPYELLIVENRSQEEETAQLYQELSAGGAKILPLAGGFNFSAACNLGAAHARGELLLFLNNDILAARPGWLSALAEQALRPAVGAVGAKLLYPDGRVQHAGAVVGLCGWADHICAGCPEGGGGYASSHLVNAVRNVSAVTGACLMCEKKKFDALGGFDVRFTLCGSDVELCLRFLQAGYRNIYTPFACLTHCESATRKNAAIPPQDFELSREAYAPYLQFGDPYYSKNLDYSSKTPRVNA